MNMVILNGRLAADPEGGESGQGVAYATFGVAIERGSGETKQTTFLDCVTFRQQADFVKKFFSKGDAINLVGSINVKDWEDPQSGAKRKKYEIVVTQVTFPVSGKAKAGNAGRYQSAPRNGERAPAPVGAAAAGSSEYDGY